MRYVLVYGLSADPIHQAHVDLLCEATSALLSRGYSIEKALIIPVYRRNPVGSVKDHLPQTFEQRFKMCELAAKEVALRLASQKVLVEVSRIEESLAKASGKPNYTLETLLALQSRETAGTQFIFLLSSDLVSGTDPEFGHWYEHYRLVKLAIIAICPRPGYLPNNLFLERLEQIGAHFVLLNELTPKDLAGREIRARLTAGEEPLVLAQEGLIPARVATFIKQHNLYKRD